MRKLIPLILFSLVWQPLQASPYFDGTFNTGDWSTTTSLEGSGSGTATLTQNGSGGNGGGSFAEIELDFDGDPGIGNRPNDLWIAGVFLNTTAVYDFSQGEILSLDYSEYAKYIEATDFPCPGNAFCNIGGQHVAGVALSQGGNLYIHTIASTGPLSDGWHEIADNVTANEFGLVSNGAIKSPDFSSNPNFVSGSDITFGFYRYTTHTNQGAFHRTHGIDDWSVTLNTAGAPAPEPGPLALLALGLLGLGLGRRALR